MRFPTKHLAYCIYFITDTAIRVCLETEDRTQLSNWKLVSGYGQIYFSNCISAVPGYSPISLNIASSSSHLTALLRVTH